jgi:hypothetical protein
MANIFKLTQDYKEIVDMADQLDDQTLEDMMEAIEDSMDVKVANTIAVIKNVESELELAKDFKKSVEEKIKTMNNTINRLKEYVMLGVDTVGKPKKGAEQFKKLELKDAPWVKSAWTQYNPPNVKVVDDRIIDEEFKVKQPDKINNAAIAKRWKEKQDEYAARRSAYLLELQAMIDANEIDEREADEALEAWEKENKHNYEVPGVEVVQTVGVRFR